MLSGNDIFTHVCLGAHDLEESGIFYDAILGVLGINNLGPFGDKAILYGKDKPGFAVLLPSDGQPATYANGGTVSFVAPDKATVDAFHAVGLANGGRDEGMPGPRLVPGSYGAYLRDPAGNKVCAYIFE